jgi:hypothetical protein
MLAREQPPRDSPSHLAQPQERDSDPGHAGMLTAAEPMTQKE